ncbi:hypothetical protein [Leptothrix sp. BB-3]
MLLVAAWILLPWCQPALAWSEKDCNRDPYGEYRHTLKKCVDAAKVAAQQKQPDGSQPSEAQRYARVREILLKQKVVQYSYFGINSRRDHQVCEARLKDLQAGRGYEPIEPVYVLDDAWQAADPEQSKNNSNAPRLPPNWNRCAYDNKEHFGPKGYPTLALYMDRLRPNPPPYRLYELKPHQRPSPEWQFMVDMTFELAPHFGAFSADSCEEIGHIGSFTDTSQQQSWALTQYQGALAVVGVIDRYTLYIKNLNDYCSWDLSSRPTKK